MHARRHSISGAIAESAGVNLAGGWGLVHVTRPRREHNLEATFSRHSGTVIPRSSHFLRLPTAHVLCDSAGSRMPNSVGAPAGLDNGPGCRTSQSKSDLESINMHGQRHCIRTGGIEKL
jgi:hypothetical protein